MPDAFPLILFGGSFDPIHRAHLRIAKQALATLGQGQVLFIPAAQSPLKAQETAATPEQRLEMLKLAVADEPDCAVCDWELKQGGKSFSIDTVRHLAEVHPGTPLYWLIGTDQLAQLPRWHAIDALVAELTFLVYRREGNPTAPPPDLPGLQLRWVDGPLLPESSTAIRKDPTRATADLPEKVAGFIRQNQLYR